MVKKKTGASKKKAAGERKNLWYCQNCGKVSSQPVVQSKIVKTGESQIHLRQCQICQTQFTTIEIVDHY
jgi:transcriptional regulator NrdR family protein